MSQRIDAKTDIGTLSASDYLLVEKNSNTTDYWTTPAEIVDYVESVGLTLGAPIIGGAQTISGTGFDINGGSIDAVTLGTNSPITEAQIDNININGNTIKSTDTNGDVNITPDGTGSLIVDSVYIQNSDIGVSGNTDLLSLSSTQILLDGKLVLTNGATRYIHVEQASGANGDDLTIYAGIGDTTGNYGGGDLNLLGGTGNGTEDGGNTVIDGGIAVGTGSAGDVKIASNRGNLVVGNISPNSSMVTGIAIKNGTAPAALIAGGIQIFADDSTDTTSTLGLYTEQVPVSGSTTPDYKVSIYWNGNEYWLPLLRR